MVERIQPVERTRMWRLNPLMWGSVGLALLWVALIVSDELGVLPLGRLPIMSLPLLTALVVAGVSMTVWRDHQANLMLRDQVNREVKRTDHLTDAVAAARERLHLVHRNDFGSSTRIAG